MGGFSTVSGGTPVTQGEYFSLEITGNVIIGFAPNLSDIQGALDGMGDALPGSTTLVYNQSVGAGMTQLTNPGYWDVIYSGQFAGYAGLTAGQFVADCLSIIGIYNSTVSVGAVSQLQAGALQVSQAGGTPSPTGSIANATQNLFSGTNTPGSGPSTGTVIIFVAIAVALVVIFGLTKEVGL